ncbi:MULTISPECIES: DNA polymerase Y family protein [Anaeromyxobacter]|uniref:Y-family DNA polymerase n=1 Tax=Anaeromyxobacter TaxID=161492 RepID=UPI001F5A6B26|nr:MULTISPECIES: DNA polymerase Y family protein [unclassified Anaeromyxobacter]
MRREASGLRVIALCLPELPLQRARRQRADGCDGPLAVVSEGRIVHCDGAAAADGVRPGATLSEALAACGRLRTVPLDPAADRAALRAVAEAVLLLAPAVEPCAPDVVLLDASAAGLLAGGAGRNASPDAGERVLAERAIAAAAEMGYAARAAVADGRAAARALVRHGAFSARTGELLHVAPGATAGAIAALPLEALGLTPAVTARLRGLGIADAGALARLPAGTLAHRFGPDGVAAARLARGEDDTPLSPYLPETLPVEALELEAPAESAEPLLFALKRLADRVAARLAGRGLGATRLKVVLKLDPRGEERVIVPLAQPTASAARWLVPAKEHVFSLRLPGAVTAVELAAIEVAPIAVEQLAIDDRPEALAALETVLARLGVRLGEGAIFAAEPVERYRPEAAYRAVPFRPAVARASALRSLGGSPGAGALAPSAAEPRPTRLVDPPTPIQAEGEGGRVTALRVEGRARAVLAMEGPERLRGEWWVPAPFDRDYYRVRLDGLGDCWVYRDAADGRLYLHGYFD